MKRKLRLGPRFAGAFKLLRAMRRLRGTPLDLFGYAHVRRVERELASEYEQVIAALLNGLSHANHAALVSLASLPDEVRGYEDVKLASVEGYRKRFGEIRAEIEHPKSAAA